MEELRKFFSNAEKIEKQMKKSEKITSEFS
jgi:hypothetical protein